MTRLQLALIVAGLLFPSTAPGEDKPKDADDPVAAELTKAKEEYLSAAGKAGEKLLAAFAEQKKKLEENTKLKVDQQIKQIEQIEEERKAFEADPSKLPSLRA